MTKLEIINTINKEFKGKAVNIHNFCCYLSADNKKCFIGLFIPNGHEGREYDSDVIGLLREYPELKKYMPSQDISFLEAFQELHDSLDINSSVESQITKAIEWVNENYDRYNHSKS